MLVGGDADGFKIFPVLALTCGLLNLLVGHKKTGKLVTGRETQPIMIAEVPLVASDEVTRRACIGVILEDRGTQVTVGHRALSADPQCVLSPSVLGQKVAIRRGEAAARQNGFAVQALRGIFGG